MKKNRHGDRHTFAVSPVVVGDVRSATKTPLGRTCFVLIATYVPK